jgi:serine/threonine protein kinase
MHRHASVKRTSVMGDQEKELKVDNNDVSIHEGKTRKQEMFHIITDATLMTKSTQTLMGAFVAAGSFGSVYRLLHDPTMALKTLKWNTGTGFSYDLVRELNVYSQITSPYVQCLRLAEVVLVQKPHQAQEVISSQISDASRFIGLISPFANAQSLDTFMVSRKWRHLFGQPATSLRMFQFICRQVLAGASAVNESGIVHQDLKPANYLVFDTDPDNLDNMLSVCVKVADMGSATLFEGPLSLKFTMGVYTPLFAPPEFLTQGVYDGRSDTWSVGVVFLTILRGAYVYADGFTMSSLATLASDAQIQARIDEVLVASVETHPILRTWPAGMLDGCGRMVKAMLVRDISTRYTTTSLLYKAFAGVPQPTSATSAATNKQTCIDTLAMSRNLLRSWSHPHQTDARLLDLRNACLTFVFQLALQLPCINIMAYVFIINTLDRILVPMRDLNNHAIQVNTVACVTLVLKCLVADQTTESQVVQTAWANNVRFTLDQLALAEASILRHINGNITLHQKWESCGSVKEVGDLLLMSFKPFVLLSFFVTTAKKNPRSSSSIVSDRVWRAYFGALPNSTQNALCNELRLQDALKMGKFKELGTAANIVTFVAHDHQFQTFVHWEEEEEGEEGMDE